MEKSAFAQLCRKFRTRNSLTQRTAAEAIGIKVGSYSNVESSPYKVIRRERAEVLARAFGLTSAERKAFLAAWEACPLSDFGQGQRVRWAKRAEFRSEVKLAKLMRAALVELLGLILAYIPDPGVLCNCEFGGGTPGDPDRMCELCTALDLLGLQRWTTRDVFVEQLAALQDQLAAEAKANLKPKGDTKTKWTKAKTKVKP